MVAPFARIAATFNGFAPFGTTIDTAPPNTPPALAGDWPWLPVEAPITPAFAVGSRPIRFRPPRTLKAAVGSRFSHLSHTSRPSALLTASRRISGVGDRWAARKSRAASTSANDGSPVHGDSPART